uniref:Uncharacterized protein n=1 Tax=Dendroctonus ponderosae TaxID=77166 RepID=A0AAR5PPU6_DENPD
MLKPLSSNPSLTRNLSFNIFKKRPNCCDKEPAKPTPKYTVQKTCEPSIFEIWKPKIPELNACNYPTIKTSMMMPYNHKTCTAGMNFREKTRCEIEAEARECQKMNHPKWIQKCPPASKIKISEPITPMKASMVTCKGANGSQKKIAKKSLRDKCDPPVPEGDWNPDGHLS